MIYEDFKKLTTDRTIRAIIGMNRETFNSLVPYFSDAYHEIQEERYENKEIKRVVVIFEVIPSQQWAIIRYYIGV